MSPTDRRYKAEQIVNILREIDVLTTNGRHSYNRALTAYEALKPGLARKCRLFLQ